MDKPRHPHVVRTWTVERTKVPYRPPQTSKPRNEPRQTFHPPAKKTTPEPGSKPSE